MHDQLQHYRPLPLHTSPTPKTISDVHIQQLFPKHMPHVHVVKSTCLCISMNLPHSFGIAYSPVCASYTRHITTAQPSGHAAPPLDSNQFVDVCVHYVQLAIHKPPCYRTSTSYPTINPETVTAAQRQCYRLQTNTENQIQIATHLQTFAFLVLNTSPALPALG